MSTSPGDNISKSAKMQMEPFDSNTRIFGR